MSVSAPHVDQLARDTIEDALADITDNFIGTGEGAQHVEEQLTT